jgi:hypothetical protein
MENKDQNKTGQPQRDIGADKQQQNNETKQSHENRERPREDHGTNHLGYNSTHLDTNPAPVREGSDKI